MAISHMSRNNESVFRRGQKSKPVVLITGASSGIGRATAHLYARKGFNLVLCARGIDKLIVVATECTDLGAANVAVMPVDVANAGDVSKVVDDVVERFGGLDICVHSAAVMSYGTFLDTPVEVFDQTVTVDLLGAANVARSALLVFRAQESGNLVIIGSLLGRIAAPWMSTYVTSKWGLRGLTRVLQQEVRQYPGVNVSSVAPGSVKTAIYDDAATVIGRAGSPPPPTAPPEVIANAVDKVVRNPQRERDADAVFGLLNKVTSAGFALVPEIFDLLIGPLLWRFGTSRENKDDTEGNIFRPTPLTNEVAQ
ncbi:short-chain dehydrogenase [Rhodococcoides trifolii]|uniref:Short-chain dehydrogenase n=1 Tax=Rhodococcoides trifolii TaxID=908250 RepID=A0A917G6N5_9NOCA|nr:SDR family NAD(P)-dependent oxidoreductase [Rhodococcus trifolii]GGG25491.1 short-chain dehydrogenase [Rhodococcus trifolii]